MKIQTIIILIIFLTSSPSGVSGLKDNHTEGIYSNECSPGENVFFMVSITNDNPHMVDIKAKLENLDLVSCSINQSEFLNVKFSEKVEFFIWAYIPYNISVEDLSFNVSIWDRPSMMGNNDQIPYGISEYSCNIIRRLFCRIIDLDNSSTNSRYLNEKLILIASLLTIIAIPITYLFSKKKYPLEHIGINFSNFSIFPQYTRLRRDRLLKNPARNHIMQILKDEKGGVTFKDLQIKLNISHPSYLNYHLRRLMEFGFIRNVDNFYFEEGASLKRPFINEIKDAIVMGARTPTEVASEINSYPQKVRYHMKKHGLLSVCDVDYSKRKR
jgi:hypothetical protein